MSDKEIDSEDNVRLVVLSDGKTYPVGSSRVMEVKQGYGEMYARDISPYAVIEDVSLNDLLNCWNKFGKEFRATKHSESK